ncbi:protein shisa-5-like [Cheilinus undulatus]|uniref:protein shisa-5-like n=1 Tax=Cheilinus undulatus TaxID=241271 RepID=UPI001BD50DAC|nr:protein shisa-5-like [Cheilinus undulatus]
MPSGHLLQAENCNSYTDSYGNYYDTQHCMGAYCCGTCNQRSCCTNRQYRLSEKDQRLCDNSYASDGRSKLATLLGSILGTILPILLCVGLVICCVAPCCLFYKKCRKGRSRTPTGPTVIHMPQQPNHPSINPGYQPVPVQPGMGGLPNPSGPPPYNPGSAAFTPGQPMYPLVPPAQPGGFSQPPYNPAYPNV